MSELLLGGAFPGTLIAAVIGFGLYWSVAPTIRPSSATQLGRKWCAWMMFLSTIAFFPKLLYHPFSYNNLAIWLIIGIIGFGSISFSLGWIFGKFRFRKPRSS